MSLSIARSSAIYDAKHVTRQILIPTTPTTTTTTMVQLRPAFAKQVTVLLEKIRTGVRPKQLMGKVVSHGHTTVEGATEPLLLAVLSTLHSLTLYTLHCYTFTPYSTLVQ